MGVKTNANIAQNSGALAGASGAEIYEYVASGGEVDLLLPYTYVIGADELSVEIEGCPLYLSDNEFYENTPTSIQFAHPLSDGEHVTVFLRK